MISAVDIGGEDHRRRRSRQSGVSRVRLSMYQEPPSEEISLDEFEMFAIDRLVVLRGIESLKARNVDAQDEKTKISEYLDKHLSWRNQIDDDFEEDKRKDLVSHFILRLAYSQSEDNRRWFLAQESALFRHRIEKLGFDEMNFFTKQNGLKFEMVSPEEKSELAHELQTVAVSTNQGSVLMFNELPYFRVPFVQALDLVGKRHVFLRDGFAYVPQSHMVNIIVARFRMNLSRELLRASIIFPNASRDPRLAPLLKGVHQQYVGKDFSQSSDQAGVVTPENLDLVAKQSMPLCMRTLHTALRREHKLKHEGRRQYWLFLKGAGLSMEDSIRFFHSEFSKIMTSDAFHKEHAYNIRHCYGKEGKRKNYSPRSCMSIIMGAQPGVGEYHGCPYKYMSEPSLSALFGSMQITGADRESVLAHVKKGHFQVACQRHFEISHPQATAKGINLDGVGNHPNAWTSASLQYHHTGTVTKEEQGPKEEGSTATQNPPSSGTAEA